MATLPTFSNRTKPTARIIPIGQLRRVERIQFVILMLQISQFILTLELHK